MGTLLSTYASSRDNNFTLVRFVASLFVLYTHSFSLTTGMAEKEPLRAMLGMSLGDIAVDIFFVTSGFLITSSYVLRGNLAAFIWARILRIYPALIVAVLFCVFVVGAWFTTLSLSEYFTDMQTYKYILKNMTLVFGVQHYLPGVFSGIPWDRAVNGSLWTLPYEIRMYMILALVLTFAICIKNRIRSITFKGIMIVMGPVSVLLHILNHFYPFLPENYIRLFSMFFIGSAFYLWKEHIVICNKWFFAYLLALLLSTTSKDLYIIVYPLVLPYLIFYIAYVPSGYIRKFNNFGDYSYGLYIYAFPVQQSLVSLFPNISIPCMIICSFFISLFFAVLSWNFIEKRFLGMKERYGFLENILRKIEPIKKCIYVNR